MKWSFTCTRPRGHSSCTPEVGSDVAHKYFSSRRVCSTNGPVSYMSLNSPTGATKMGVLPAAQSTMQCCIKSPLSGPCPFLTNVHFLALHLHFYLPSLHPLHFTSLSLYVRASS